jgi:hypothetical protein
LDRSHTPGNSCCQQANIITGRYLDFAIEFEACAGYPVNLPIQGKNNRIRALGRDKHNAFSAVTVENKKMKLPA